MCSLLHMQIDLPRDNDINVITRTIRTAKIKQYKYMYWMLEQVNNVCRSSYASLHSIGRIRKCLDVDAVKTLVHALLLVNLIT